MKNAILLTVTVGAAFVAASASAQTTVSTAFGAGADMEFRENLSSDVFTESTSNGDSQNTRTSGNNDRNEIVGLKFDLTGYNLADLTSVSLNLFSYRADGSTRELSLYGVAQGTVSGSGNFTTETWNETATLFGDLPGLQATDGNAGTQSLNLGALTPLGNYTITSGQPEGSVQTLDDASITSFLQGYAGSQYVTFVLAANNTSSGQFRTATKEATQTATGVLTGNAGDFAGYLSFTVVPEPTTFALLGLGGLAMAVIRRRV